MKSRRRVNSTVGALCDCEANLVMTMTDRRPGLAPAIMSILTFCIVTVVVVDAVMPLGYIFVRVLIDSDLQVAMRVLFLAPMLGLLVSSFVCQTLWRASLLWPVPWGWLDFGSSGYFDLWHIPFGQRRTPAVQRFCPLSLQFRFWLWSWLQWRGLSEALCLIARPNKSLDASGGSLFRN
jgi:hypothetical protein